MNTISFRLRPRAPWATPWHADSLFGAVCWELVRRGGEDALSKMLGRFRNGEPPFLLSDACPADLLPRPLVLAGGPPEEERAWRAQKWVTRDYFLAARNGRPEPAQGAGRQPASASSAGLAGLAPPDLPQAWRPVRRLHISLNRNTGEDAPSLFETEEWTWADHVADEKRFLTLYVRAFPEWVETLHELLAGVGSHGFGKRRSLGRGAFDVDGKAETCAWLDPMPHPEDGFISLNHYIPHEADPVKGRWTVHVKYPKYGEVRGSGSTPFKGRLLQLGPGSCFQFPGRPRRWYGTMVSGLPGYQDAMHYGLALAIGMKWPRG